MEEDSQINFKALRAKFQEEALLAQSKSNRPAVAEKPKHLPPPGGRCSSVLSSISATPENKTAVVPRVIFREGLRASGGKRPNSFPPQPQINFPSSQFTNGDGTTKQSLRDRHMPLVLPVLPVKEQSNDSPAKTEHKQESDAVKEFLQQNKIKKKGLLLPFKSSKPSKVCTESVEETTYTDLTARPSSAPGELPSGERNTTEDECSFQGDLSNLSSPDVSITPPSTEANFDPDNRIISTLERAKRKFSRRQVLLSTKPKSVPSPDHTSRERMFPSPPKSMGSVASGPRVPSPIGLPHLACISARPFFKANNPSRKTLLETPCSWGKAESPFVKATARYSHVAPPKKPLSDLRSLGLPPVKPPRPPSVDLSRYHPHIVKVEMPSLSQQPIEEPEAEPPSISNALLDAPEFPDFEISEIETAEIEAVDIAALETEALGFVSSVLPTNDFGVSKSGDPQHDFSEPAEHIVSSVFHDVNLGNQNIIPLDPASFPEPINVSETAVAEEWREGEDVSIDPCSHPDEMEVSAAEYKSVPEETEHSFHAAVNEELQPHQRNVTNFDYSIPPSVQPKNSYYECDNVYEDVENLNGFILSHNLRKHKAGLKNPYADKLPVKEEACLNIWPRNPWGSISGEHTYLIHNHFHSKERQSPNTADYKEQRKREKHRLEKEKKEQKEREKKENEMKKKFKITGEEEPLYHAKVMVTSKVRKNDLPVKSGETVSIIRTTNCPKGKWLARDANHKYGYISVMNVELNIKEMLELGKKAQAAGRGCNMEGDTISIGSRSSSHPVLTSSFTDDSEEWACDDETLSPFYESHLPQQTAPVPVTSRGPAGAQHTLSDANLEELHAQTRHDALHKLAVFLHDREEFDEVPDNDGATPTNAEHPNFLDTVDEPPYPEQEVDFTELELLAPPPLYADSF